ncbi:MAG: hypothetical protein JO157_02795 [Acetobacteraceae bacterium]|nr:hypothetical protein [Acetobacteraceae bacterium]
MTTRHAWIVPLLVMLTGCQVAQPPLRRTSLVTLRGTHRPAFELGREDGSSGAALAGRWAFSTTAGECIATAPATSRSPAVTVHVDRAAHLAVLPGHGASRLAFSGSGGSWTLHAAGNGRSSAATLPLDEGAVTQLLALLEGGQLRLEGGAHPASVLLADAGVSGRDWIGCVSAKAREASSTAGQ